MSKRDRNWDQVKWTPFEEFKLEGAPRDARTFVNAIYQVEVEERVLPTPFGHMVWLSFKTRDRQPRHNWREMQTMKNEILTLLGYDGAHVEGVELFPDEDRLVDTSNQYHLWCFPGFRFPFGYDERLVAEESAPGGGERRPGCARQTGFRPELRPPDALPHARLAALSLTDKVRGRCPACGAGFVERADRWECLKNAAHRIPL